MKKTLTYMTLGLLIANMQAMEKGSSQALVEQNLANEHAVRKEDAQDSEQQRLVEQVLMPKEQKYLNKLLQLRMETERNGLDALGLLSAMLYNSKLSKSVSELLAAGVDPKRDSRLGTAIALTSNRNTLELLINAGADINATKIVPTRHGEIECSALICACTYGRLDDIVFALKHGATRDLAHGAALRAAIMSQHLTHVIALLQTEDRINPSILEFAYWVTNSKGYLQTITEFTNNMLCKLRLAEPARTNPLQVAGEFIKAFHIYRFDPRTVYTPAEYIKWGISPKNVAFVQSATHVVNDAFARSQSEK